MKKLFSFLLLSAAITTSAQAEMTTVWQGIQRTTSWDWDYRLELPADKFNALNNGDQMVIAMEQNVADATAADELWYQYEIMANDYVEDRNPQRTMLSKNDLTADGDVTITLTDEQVSLLKQYGMIINGHYVTITQVAIGTPGDTPDPDPDEGTTVELWSGSVNSGDWDSDNGVVALSYGDKPAALGTAKKNDVITVTCTATGEGAHIQIANPDGWNAFDTECDVDLTTQGEQTFDYTIREVGTLELIQRDGILVRGKNITITKVELTTYAHSYDAALVTIGAEGVATYSNSNKNLDFSAAPVKAYYATAVETGKVTLSPTASVPAYTGIVVTGETGEYEIPVGTAEAPATNYLKAVGDWDGTVTASAAGAYHFLLDNAADQPIFTPVTADTPIEAHKAYLETTEDITPTDGGSIVLVFTDTPHTGLDNVQAEQGDGYYYTLQGVRLAYPTTPGIYIHNGQKVFVRL